MNFKLVENFDNTREYVQEYLYDAITELGSASLSDYIQWFKDNTDDYDSEIEQALTDAYIEAVDYGTITDVDKTMITSELWSYIDSHEDLLEYDHVALLQQCPQHLQHELKIVLNKLEESLNEELLTEGLHSDLQTIAALMSVRGYTNIVIDEHTNKIVGDKANKTYLFEVIFDRVTPRLNDRFYVNYADSVNRDKEVHLQPVTPVGASIGKAGIGRKRPENRRHYIDKIFIWELKYLSDASDPTTWP